MDFTCLKVGQLKWESVKHENKAFLMFGKMRAGFVVRKNQNLKKLLHQSKWAFKKVAWK